MNRLHLAILSVSLLLGVAAAQGQFSVITHDCPPTSAAPNQLASSFDFISLRRTTCLGDCPSYTVRIRADGEVEWSGQRFVVVKGVASSQVAPERARELIDSAIKQGFWGLCGNYSGTLTDGTTVITRSDGPPPVVTSVGIGGQQKTVSNYYSTAPGWLQDLEDRIDAVADSHRWIHGEPVKEIFNRAPTWSPQDLEESPLSRLRTDAVRPKPGVTPLMTAAARGDLSQVEIWVGDKATLNAQDSSGWTALMYATQASNAVALKRLLEAGADPNIRSHMGQTALMTFIDLERVRLLVEAGADVNAQDKNGQTTLMFGVYRAVRNNAANLNAIEVEILSYLRKMGARLDPRDTGGRSALDHLELRRQQIAPGETTVQAQYERVKKALE